jgi:hypothetical protein
VADGNSASYVADLAGARRAHRAAASLVAFALTARTPAQRASGPLQLNGRTREGIVIWARERAGSIRTIHVVWRGVCWNGGSSWATFGPGELSRARRSFAGSVSYRGTPAERWVPRITTTMSGALAPDSRSADGIVDGSVTWVRGRRRGVSCDSGPISWHMAAP